MTNIEDSLKRLDKLTQEEVRMATAEALKTTHIVDDKVTEGVKDTQVIKRQESAHRFWVSTLTCPCRKPIVGEPSQMALPTRPVHQP